MISNFIAHLRQSEYRGEKFSRPTRQTAATQRKTESPNQPKYDTPDDKK